MTQNQRKTLEQFFHYANSLFKSFTGNTQENNEKLVTLPSDDSAFLLWSKRNPENDQVYELGRIRMYSIDIVKVYPSQSSPVINNITTNSTVTGSSMVNVAPNVHPSQVFAGPQPYYPAAPPPHFATALPPDFPVIVNFRNANIVVKAITLIQAAVKTYNVSKIK